MSYSDLTATFDYKDLVQWQNLDALAENDKFLRELYAKYRRPNLIYVSVTEVDVESNTPSANETEIIFPDNEVRTVLEDTAVTSQHRRFKINEAADFDTTLENSGLRPGLSEADNTWYAIYVVKSQLSSTKFVLVGDTDFPIVANFSTLNSRYGANSWLYLGMIRNGDNIVNEGDILSFIQSGERTFLTNAYDADSSGIDTPGIMFAQDALNSQKWTYAVGTGSLEVPETVGFLFWNCLFFSDDDVGDIVTISSSDETKEYFKSNNSASVGLEGQITQLMLPPEEGIHFDEFLGGDKPRCSLYGWNDNVLGFGFNPQL